MQLTQMALRSVVLHVRHLSREARDYTKDYRIRDPHQYIKTTLPVEIMHWEASVAGYFVQAQAGGDSFVHHVLVAKDFVVCKELAQ